VDDERRLPASDLVGSQEIAERLGWKNPESVHNARRRDPTFPKPFAKLGAAIIWSWSDIEAWAQRTGRLPQD
jgi:predicted DNA-binding transcriptional regulator AlpA